MQTLKIKYKTSEEDLMCIEEYMRQYSYCLHISFNRLKDGFTQNEIEHYLKTMNNLPLMNSWFIKCAAYNCKSFKDKIKVIFGGRRNFIQRCQGKITKEEFRLKRLSPIESNGEANSKGNRFLN